MLILSGAPAASDFRLAKLLSSIRERCGSIELLDSRYVHFVDLERELDAGQASILESLLRYGPAAPCATPRGQVLLVVPRFGTVSPWSSKATDIAHVCGLAAVRRIERGVAYYIDGPGRLSEEQWREASSLLHDRMTEAVLREAGEAAGLFQHAAPKPLATVPLAAQGRAALESANSTLGLALSDDEIDYLVEAFRALGRDPADVGTLLDVDYNIATRTGLQCAPLIHDFMGTSPRGTVRMSIGPANKESDVDAAIRAVTEIAAAAPRE